jgi:hypothetical protein
MRNQRDSLAARRERRLEAEANLAIEGIYLTEEERALFEEMEEQGLSQAERTTRIDRFIAAKLKRPAAAD